MKRVFTLLLAIFLVLGLCGCNLFSKSAQTPTDTAESSDLSLPEDQIINLIEEDSAPSSQVPSTPKIPAWKTAYKTYILEQVDTDEYQEFQLVYIDGDDVPELLIRGSYEAAGEYLCTYYDGTVRSQIYGRLGGLSYVKRSGRYMHFNGNMGYYSLSLCTLKNGVFQTVVSGLQEEDMSTYNPDTGELDYRYTLEGDTVTEESFNKTIQSWFGNESSVRIGESTCSLSEILAQLS